MPDKEELEQLLETDAWCTQQLELQDWRAMHPDLDIPEDELIPFSEANDSEVCSEED